MHIREVDSSIATIQAFNSFLIVLHAMDQKEVGATFRSAAQFFEGGSKVVAECCWFGKHEIPGTYVGGSAARVNCFVAIIQLEKRMMKAISLAGYQPGLQNRASTRRWLKRLYSSRGSSRRGKLSPWDCGARR